MPGMYAISLADFGGMEDAPHRQICSICMSIWAKEEGTREGKRLA